MRTIAISTFVAAGLLALPAVGQAAALTLHVKARGGPERATVSISYRTLATVGGTLVDDAGAPLADTVVLVTETPLASGPATTFEVVTNAEGRFARQVAPNQNMRFTAHVPGPGLPADSRAVHVGVAPRLVNVSDRTQTGGRFVIRVRVVSPHPRSDGRVYLRRYRVVGGGWRTLSAKYPGTGNVVRFVVAHAEPGTYRYSLRFKPANPLRLVTSSLLFRIRFLDPS